MADPFKDLAEAINAEPYDKGKALAALLACESLVKQMGQTLDLAIEALGIAASRMGSDRDNPADWTFYEYGQGPYPVLKAKQQKRKPKPENRPEAES